MTTIGQRVKHCRLLMGLRQIDIAMYCKMPRSYISKIENDALTPRPEVLQRIADAIGATIVDLLPPEYLKREDSRIAPVGATNQYWSCMTFHFTRLHDDDKRGVINWCENVLEE